MHCWPVPSLSFIFSIFWTVLWRHCLTTYMCMGNKIKIMHFKYHNKWFCRFGMCTFSIHMINSGEKPKGKKMRFSLLSLPIFFFFCLHSLTQFTLLDCKQKIENFNDSNHYGKILKRHWKMCGWHSHCWYFRLLIPIREHFRLIFIFVFKFNQYIPV